MMSSIDPCNNTTVVTAAQDQDKKEVHSQHTVESLLQKLREKDAVIAEKDAVITEKDEQLSAALANNNTDPNHSLARISEDRSVGDGEPNHFGSLSTSGVSTFADYLQSRRSSKARWRNSVVSDLTHRASTATVRTAEEMRVIRRIDRRAAAEWDHLSYGAPEAEDGTVSGEDDGHGSRTPWYNPPIQRQKWCEDQSLPHINWGDIFFDLFYVGAAFNL